MKKIYTIAACLFFLGSSLLAQNEVDALRYSQNYYGGTARSMSMAGSFGALGGDFSSLSINPAGIGVYRKSEMTFTPTILFNNTSTAYLNNISSEDDYKFLMNNLGLVLTTLNKSEDEWVSYSFGIGYNRLNNFNRDFLMRGVQTSGLSTSSSLLDWMAVQANIAYFPADFNHFQESMAYDADLLYLHETADTFTNDIVDDSNGQVPYGQYQRRSVQESGGIGEYTFSFGANYGDKLYVGTTIGIHRLQFSQNIDHLEADDNYVIEYFDSFTFKEHLDAYGTGYTFKLGLIFRPISLIRIGAAFHLPTFYKISEEYHTSIESNFDPEFPEASSIYFPSDDLLFDYKLRTPYKLIGSVGFQIPKLATFNVDYEFMDYRRTNMESPDYGFYDENDVIEELYTYASNIRVGAEVRTGPMYIRGGAGFYGSPFMKLEENRSAYTMVYAGGLGLRSQGFFIDFGYTLRKLEESYYAYVLPNAQAADVTSKNSQFIATLGFRF